MKKAVPFSLALLMFTTFTAISQTVRSGNYEELDIAYNPQTHMLTGYFESSTGFDEQTEQAKFSCIFYLEGKLSGNKATVKTLYTRQPLDDVITGKLEVADNKTIKIHLPDEHGGCWNVQHFADAEPAVFTFDQAQPWIEIRYVQSDKVSFFDRPGAAAPRKAYLVKGDVVRISKLQDGFALCSYTGGKKETTGWVNLKELNAIEAVQ